MTRLFLFLFFFLSSVAMGQINFLPMPERVQNIAIDEPHGDVVGRTEVDKVIYAGLRKWEPDSIGHSDGLVFRRHDWVLRRDGPKNTSCSVLHNPAGCPDSWWKGWRICRVCLRKEYVREVYEFVPRPDPFDVLDKQVESARRKP